MYTSSSFKLPAPVTYAPPSGDPLTKLRWHQAQEATKQDQARLIATPTTYAPPRRENASSLRLPVGVIGDAATQRAGEGGAIARPAALPARSTTEAVLEGQKRAGNNGLNLAIGGFFGIGLGLAVFPVVGAFALAIGAGVALGMLLGGPNWFGAGPQ